MSLPDELSLENIRTGTHFVVRALTPHPHHPEWMHWLEDIGFLPGEPGQLMARALPAGDPMVVRIGLSTFALRREEAACVRVSVIEERLQ